MSLLPGEFLKFVISWTEAIGPIHHLLRKRQPDARMSDVELAIRYLAFKDQKTQYAGDLKLFLDEFCKNKNSEFTADPQKQVETRDLLSQMNEAIDAGLSEFTEREFCRKYSNGSYETRFNRALFDVLVGALSRPDVRQWTAANPGAMKQLYEDVCGSHPEFVKAVETTTKSPEATRNRFTIWYEAVENITRIQMPIPDIKQ